MQQDALGDVAKLQALKRGPTPWWCAALGGAGAGGAQYCAWHPNSRLLAVSSDALKMVMVFDVILRQPVAVFRQLRRPCLALAFPSAPNLAQAPTLVFAENARNVYVAGRQQVATRLIAAHIHPVWIASWESCRGQTSGIPPLSNSLCPRQ